MEKLLTDRQYGFIFTLLLCISRNSIVSDVWRPYFYQLRSWVVAQEPWVICLRYTCLKRLNIIDVKHIHFPDRLKEIRVYVNGRETNHHEKQSSLFVALEKSTIISLCTVLSRLVGQDIDTKGCLVPNLAASCLWLFMYKSTKNNIPVV